MFALWITAIVGVTALPARTDRMIYDEAGVIDDAEERRLEQATHELWQKAGVAVVVLTVPQLTDETIDELAVRLGQTWGVGKRGEDRGLVVAFARDDRKIFVATGYGTEGYLPDARVGRLIDQHALPALKQNRFSQGLVALTDVLLAESAQQFGVALTGATAPVEESAPRGVPFLIVIVGVVLVLALLRSRRRGGGWSPFLWFGNPFGGWGGFGGTGGFGGGFGSGGFGGGGFGGGGAGRSF